MVVYNDTYNFDKIFALEHLLRFLKRKLRSYEHNSTDLQTRGIFVIRTSNINSTRYT